MKHIVFLCVTLFMISSVSAEEIHLKNGDRISGKIIFDADDMIIIKTQGMGELTIDKSFIVKEQEEIIQDPLTPKWNRKLSVGFSQSGGNTENALFSGKFDISRKTNIKHFL